jgi:hypothetical protein
VPIALAALAAAVRTAPDPRHSTEARIPDLLGGATLMLGIGALTLAPVQGPDGGWESGQVIGTFVVAAAALAATVLRSARAGAPVIDLALFRDRAFTWTDIGAFMLSLAFGLQLLGLVFWTQEGWGWSAIRTGLAISPGPPMVSVTSLGLSRYTSKLPAGLVAALGGVALGPGAVLIGTSLGAHPDYYEVLPGWLLCGAGVGLWTPTLVGAATSGLARHTGGPRRSCHVRQRLATVVRRAAGAAWPVLSVPSARRISSTLCFASPNSMPLFSRKKRGFCTPA